MPNIDNALLGKLRDVLTTLAYPCDCDHYWNCEGRVEWRDSVKHQPKCSVCKREMVGPVSKSNCNVCGRELINEQEDRLGLCAACN